MKTHNNQAGFAHLALVLVIAVLVVMGFVGYNVYNRQQNKPVASSDGQPSDSAAAAKDIPSAPAINSPSDLDKASATLDQVDNEAGNTRDSSQLDSALNNF